MKRPWHVFVRDIGPTFTFANPERAHERAAQLVGDGGYAEVIVSDYDGPMERTVYRFDRREPVVEELTPGGWYPKPAERTVTAGVVESGQMIRVEQGPKTGMVGTVEHVTLTTQFRTGFPIAIIDMTDGRRAVRMQSDPVTVLGAGS